MAVVKFHHGISVKWSHYRDTKILPTHHYLLHSILSHVTVCSVTQCFITYYYLSSVTEYFITCYYVLLHSILFTVFAVTQCFITCYHLSSVTKYFITHYCVSCYTVFYLLCLLFHSVLLSVTASMYYYMLILLKFCSVVTAGKCFVLSNLSFICMPFHYLNLVQLPSQLTFVSSGCE